MRLSVAPRGETRVALGLGVACWACRWRPSLPVAGHGYVAAGGRAHLEMGSHRHGDTAASLSTRAKSQAAANPGYPHDRLGPRPPPFRQTRRHSSGQADVTVTGPLLYVRVRPLPCTSEQLPAVPGVVAVGGHHTLINCELRKREGPLPL